MRIAFIGENIIPKEVRGGERYVEEVSLCMAEKGHQIFVYGSKENLSKKILSNKNIKTIFLPSFPSKNIEEIAHGLFASIHALFIKYDVIHYQSKKTLAFSKIFKIFNPAAIIVLSSDLQCEFKNKPKNISCQKDIDAISKWKIRSKRYLLFADDLIKEKGVHLLIEAFKQLEDSAITPNNFKLVLAELGERDEEYVNYLRTISEGRSNIILIKAPTKKILDQLFSHAYLFTLTDSKTLLERAMQCGLAPLVSNSDENKAIVGEAGFYFDPRSPIELKDKLAYLLSRSEEVENFGKLAKEKIERRYSWETIAQNTIEKYQK